MKPINEMSIQECLDTLRHSDTPLADAYEVADRIHDLTRWIPVEERLPAKEDGDENGRVLVCSIDLRYDTRYYESWVFDMVSVEGGTQWLPTHWRRIDKP